MPQDSTIVLQASTFHVPTRFEYALVVCDYTPFGFIIMDSNVPSLPYYEGHEEFTFVELLCPSRVYCVILPLSFLIFEEGTPFIDTRSI